MSFHAAADLLDRVLTAHPEPAISESKRSVGCTGCRHCVDKGCPAGIHIPDFLRSLNMLHRYQDLCSSRKECYETMGEHRPIEYLDCGSCERK